MTAFLEKAREKPRTSVEVVGGFTAMLLDTVRAVGKRPFAYREFVEQTTFIAGVSLFPAIMVTVPFVGVVILLINQLLGEIGAIDLSGTTTGLAVLRQIGPVASVLVTAGAGATAIAADLGARTIREEIDAMRVLGIDPVQRLVLPRVLASTLVSVCLTAVITVVGVFVAFFISVGLQDAAAGQFVAVLTVLTQAKDFYVSLLKSMIFGLLAGFVACYRGLKTKGGSKGVGEAVNETVVISFVILFILNAIITAIDIQLRLSRL
jgi:phospholipid/cholesterol/gamma-HCH transport system permease protein